MKNILIFAGTTEGRRLSEALAGTGIAHTICVATEYGEIVLKEHSLVHVHRGRMNREEMQEYLESDAFDIVVDATHPYAEAVTENIKAAVATAQNSANILYIRLKRDTMSQEEGTGVSYFADNSSCAKALERIEGNILLTTGSKELAVYCQSGTLKDRLYVRVLPGMESLKICMEQGIQGKQIVALQGPFSEELNEAILRQYKIRCMVTKKSGRAGGYEEKLAAARNVGIPVFVVGQASAETGDSFETVCKRLEQLCGQKILCQEKYEITLAGIGMGNRENLTREAWHAIEQADVIFGAKRVIEKFQPRVEKKPYYQASQIILYLKEVQRNGLVSQYRRVVILFSGDSGFFSGCPAVYQALKKETDCGNLSADITVLPGISSVAYLAACVGVSYQDAAIYSIHGKKELNLAEKIRHHKKVFLLMSGVEDVRAVGAMLLRAGETECQVTVGYQMSYPEQQIRTLTPEQCCKLQQEGLYLCLIQNPDAPERKLTHGRSDADFLREKVPMTKEEVREVSICKLKLREHAIVYDVGSGTGSIAVEMAELSDTIQVYAIEKKEEAAALIERNREKFQLDNLEVIRGSAPEVLEPLPVPTHAFIGGSSGNLKEILQVLYRKNPRMRIVLNAISLETISELKEIEKEFLLQEEEILQMQVIRARTVGSYHLMQAENPIWICSFTFREVEDEV